MRKIQSREAVSGDATGFCCECMMSRERMLLWPVEKGIGGKYFTHWETMDVAVENFFTIL